ncbi:hypothetical protein BJ508DRAFT_304695 [Ascobolus immersus RN42]|uniref:Uncharacterized protein n=1 Tax=Ascobolus immersus RN42 TaxID=1160509 RepID=A0A3N4IBQ0_ASCIM|nr:hypothetical protein BJ508DRAFT_304695 [Ascobolus immersus RN42]
MPSPLIHAKPGVRLVEAHVPKGQQRFDTGEFAFALFNQDGVHGFEFLIKESYAAAERTSIRILHDMERQCSGNFRNFRNDLLNHAQGFVFASRLGILGEDRSHHTKGSSQVPPRVKLRQHYTQHGCVPIPVRHPIGPTRWPTIRQSLFSSVPFIFDGEMFSWARLCATGPLDGTNTRGCVTIAGLYYIGYVLDRMSPRYCIQWFYLKSNTAAPLSTWHAGTAFQPVAYLRPLASSEADIAISGTDKTTPMLLGVDPASDPFEEHSIGSLVHGNQLLFLSARYLQCRFDQSIPTNLPTPYGFNFYITDFHHEKVSTISRSVLLVYTR